MEYLQKKLLTKSLRKSNKMNMEKTEIKEKVFAIVAEVCETTEDQINDNTTIGDFPQWDSVGQLTIILSVETEFGINFEPEEMMEIEDVKDIVNAVESKL